MSTTTTTASEEAILGSMAMVKQELITLRDATNLTPHKVVVLREDKMTTLFEFPPDEGEALRLVQGAKREVFYVVVGKGEGDDVLVPCNIGPPIYSGLNREPPDGPVIVSELVARHLVETGFKFPIFVPDTNPESVVRIGGVIIGVANMTLYNPGVLAG